VCGNDLGIVRKKGVSMKLTKKLLGIAAITAVIGFIILPLTGCPAEADDGVTTVPVTGVSLNQKSITLTVGGSVTLTATVAPDNATNKAVSWSSSDPAKATVSNGVVTAVAEGTTTITVTTVDGGKKDTCTVTVTDSSGNIDGKTPITAAEIGITAPVKGSTPETTATVSGSVNFTNSVTWSPNDNPFKGETIYTATVTLTAKSGYTFTGLTSANAKINGNAADLTNNTGETVMLSYIFPATLNKAAGAAVNAPTLSSTSGGYPSYYNQGSATINAVTTNNGQSVEYGISTTNNASTVIEWQDGLTFNNLIKGIVDYQFIFARSKGDDNHLAGAASAGLPVTIPLDMQGNTTEHLGDLLASLPENTTATPYTIKLIISYFVNQTTMASEGSQLRNNSTKYVCLDLSDSTFTSMPSYAFFENCTSLVSVTFPVTLPNSVNSIATNAFRGCTNFTSVTLPNNVTSIGSSAFGNCTSLTSINIPNNVTTISPQAFQNCTSLTSITIPNSVTTQIGPQTFQNCTSLISVRFERVGITFAAGAFIDTANSTSLQTAYTAGGIGTYTRPDTTSTTWTKVSD
jgi:hypothetical protein